MPWYRGPTLLAWLETVETSPVATAQGFRLPVQSVRRPDASFRGFAGLIAAGTVRPGQTVTILPSGATTRVARIVTYDGDLPVAVAGQAVTLTLADETDVSRGSVIASGPLPAVAAQTTARLFWMSETPLAAGDAFLAKLGTQLVPARVTAVVSRIDLDSMQEEPVSRLAQNEIGDVTLVLDRPVVMERYGESRDLGGLILIDRESRGTVAMGLVQEPATPSAAASADPVQALIARSSAWLAEPFTAPFRSMLKAVTWRVLGTILTVAVAYALTRDLSLALVLGGIEILVKFALYVGHERLWAHIGIGVRPTPPDPAR